jgi:hypothetical protein
MTARFGPVLDAIEGVTEFAEEQHRHIKAAIERIRNDAMTRPGGKLSPRQEAIWDAAMDFFPDHVKLADSIEKDEGLRGLKPNVTPEQALKVLLYSHIDVRRREIRGMTEHEDRICSKIRSIRKVLIQEVMQKNGRLPFAGYECSWEVVHEIRKHIRHNMPDDPRIGTLKIGTIKGYLDFCCDECRQSAAQDYERSQDDDVRARQLQRLVRCIEHLNEPERGIVRASLEQDKGAEYRRREGMEMAEFQRLLRLAKQHLRRCLDSEE